MSGRELVVRRAQASDRDVLVEFGAALASETEGQELDRPILTSGVERALGDPNRGTYWVAERDGVVVGSLGITREWSDWRDGWIWWIQSVYTAPAARRCRSLQPGYHTCTRPARPVHRLWYMQHEHGRPRCHGLLPPTLLPSCQPCRPPLPPPERCCHRTTVTS